MPAPSPTTPSHVLFVEDDPDVAADVSRTLRGAGYDTAWARDGSEALRRLADAESGAPRCHLVVLDLGLPGIDGLDVCRRIREGDMRTPILILSGRAEKRDIVRGLELGADDYVTKPFDAGELLARVASLLRRTAANGSTAVNGDGPIRRGALIVHAQSRRVVLRDEAVPLTPKEFDLLLLLVRSPDRTFTRDEILDAVWGTEFDGYAHTVNTHINRLRGKIESDPASPTCIQTVWGVGYRFADSDSACS